jgi:hypothetical protein
LPLSSSLGDVVFRYGLYADGDWGFWGKGVWFTETFEEMVEKGSFCGFGKEGCTIEITKNGFKEWWVQVKTADGLTGWVRASKLTGDKSWHNGNFAELCRLD